MASSISIREPIRIKIDKSGRIVVPQAIREHLNLQPGVELEIYLETENEIVLKAVPEQPQLVEREGFPVIDGEWTENPDQDWVSQHREERIDHLIEVSGINKK